MVDSFISSQLATTIDVKSKMLADLSFMELLETVCRVCAKSYQDGNKLLIAGNGGSAADSQHIAGELISRFYYDRPALPAIALNTDTSTLTAIGNDYGYENVFSRQIEANAVKGDVFLAISTSGNSLNLLKAAQACRDRGVTIVGLTGKSGGKLAEVSDYCLKVPSQETPRVQEAHIVIGHIICSYIEKVIFPQQK